MEIIIIHQPFHLVAHGLSGVAENKDYVGTAFKLADKLWQIIRANDVKNKGQNIWIYESGESVFAGIELDAAPLHDIGLEEKRIILEKYAYYKHIGSYKLIKQAGQQMQNELKMKGLEIISPYIEIYGHWMEDENKLETALLMAIK